MANMAKRIDVGEKAQYRKIDVDAYEEDRYIEEEGVADASVEAAVTSRAAEVRTLLQKGSTKDAVMKALENPPVNAPTSVKVKFFLFEVFLFFLFFFLILTFVSSLCLLN